MLTDGGPDRATLPLPIYSFDKGFEQFQYGYASAMMLPAFWLPGPRAAAVPIVRRWRLGVTGRSG